MISQPNKRGQLTLFIILGILIFMGIIGIFLLKGTPTTSINPKENPSKYIEKCMSDSIEEASQEIFRTAGITNPKQSTFYNKTNITYLCYTPKYKELCTSQEPLLKQKIEQELTKKTKPIVESCFEKLKESFENYNYQEEPLNYTIEISPKTIKSISTKKISISGEDEFQTFNEFVYKGYSPAFDFVLISNTIIRQELDCPCGQESCTPNLAELAYLNKDFIFDYNITIRSEKIYGLTDRATQQEFKFAIRNCVII